MDNQTQQVNEQATTQQNVAPKPSYNPLMDNVNDKPYSVQSVNVAPEQMNTYIPEPIYQPQAVGGRENPYQKIKEQSGTATSSGSGSSANNPPPINPSVSQLPEGERKEGAKYVAKVVLDVYEQLHVWVNASLPISQKKLRRLENEGQIDLSMQVNDGHGNIVPAGAIIDEFNNEVKDSFSVDPKWRKETTPILEEVLAKRGATMTPEQMLMFQFGKDIGMKALQFVQIKKQQSEIIQLLKDIKDSQGGGSYTPPPPPSDVKTNNDITEQPYAYAPSNEPIVDNSNFNFETNETVMASTVQQMKVPSTGKARVIAQREKEKKWKRDAEQSESPLPYEKAMEQRKTGKRGRKKSVSDYVKNVNKDDIVDALILSETKNEDSK